MTSKSGLPDLLCFSHLRWNFVFQRPQHLMTRFAAQRRVFFFEEPLPDEAGPRLELRRDGPVTVVVPHLPASALVSRSASEPHLRLLLDRLVREQQIGAQSGSFVAWYYTPMALGWTAHLTPAVSVYDCMDELSRFKGAPVDMAAREAELLARVDLVFTGGRTLHEAKRALHPRVHCFPSSVDVEHFSRARSPLPDPADQASVARPRLGYAGVIDERLDLELIRGVAAARPDWQLVMLGPVVKIDPATLPTASNIHYLGMKAYDDLPRYLAGWDVALLPFAHNEATRFISPTKTPEYLAAGRPVVSTSITDVVRPYGAEGLVHIGDTVDEWVAGIGAGLRVNLREHRARADRLLAQGSWNETARRMSALMAGARRAPALSADSALAV